MRYTVFFGLLVILCLLTSGCKQGTNPTQKEEENFEPDTSDMQAFLKETRKLAETGNYRLALKRQIWFHNHVLDYDSGFTGVRLSFALADWQELGGQYNPAMDSFIKYRDEATRSITGEKGTKLLFADVAAFNRALKEEEKTIDLFRFLSDKDSVLAKESFRTAVRYLLPAKEYVLVKKYLTDPMALYKKEEAHYLEMMSHGPDLTIPMDASNSLIKYTKDNFVERVLDLIDYCKATGDNSSARQIQEKSLAVLKDERLVRAV